MKVPHFAMVNLIAGEEVVPELVQQDFTAEKVVAALRAIIPDGVVRQKMVGGLKRVKTLLRVDTAGHAPERAAEAVADLLRIRASDI